MNRIKPNNRFQNLVYPVLILLILLLLLEVQRPFIDRQRGFFHRFGERRMGMTDERDIFGRSAKFHGNNGFGDELRGHRSDDVHAQHTIGTSSAMNLTKPVVSPRARARPLAMNGNVPVR